MIFIFVWILVKIGQNPSKHIQQKITFVLGHPGLKWGKNANPAKILIYSYMNMFEFFYKLLHWKICVLKWAESFKTCTTQNNPIFGTPRIENGKKL